MKTILVWLLAAGWLLAACGPQVAATPEVVSSASICSNGVEFTPGDKIDLGKTTEFSAALDTHDGHFEDSATLTIFLPDGEFSPSGSILSQDGETTSLMWGEWAVVSVKNCSGKYFYLSELTEPAEPVRDAVCGAGFGGPAKRFPFFDQILLFRPVSGEEVWLYTGIGSPVLIGRGIDGSMTSVEVERPNAGQTTISYIPTETGVLEVAVKNCDKILYYAAIWRFGK